MAIETPGRIAILGAGPIGLEAALYARYLGYDVDLYERGHVADNVLRWGHVQMFSPFGANRSLLGLAALRAQDTAWQPPDDGAHLTGRELAERYLLPLAQSDLLVDSIHEQTEVLSVGRASALKGELVGETREEAEFQLLLRASSIDEPAAHEHAGERMATADAVIDATGTFGQHNWLGPGGMPALGELAARAHVEYGLPDVLGGRRSHYAGRSVLLVGDGDSAAASLVGLAELATQTADTWITWITRSAVSLAAAGPLSVHENDPLPERARLRRLANQLAADDSNHVTHLGGTQVESIRWHADLERFVVCLAGQRPGELEFDRVIANVGYRPDPRIDGELQVDHCSMTDAAQPASDDAPGSRGVLILREPDFYVLGAKSKGRDSTFLIADGLRQIRDLFAILGDRADLDLYATMGPLAARTHGN